MLFFNRGEQVSMCHFKEIEIGFINMCFPYRVEKGSNNGITNIKHMKCIYKSILTI